VLVLVRVCRQAIAAAIRNTLLQRRIRVYGGMILSVGVDIGEYKLPGGC
jgi:hypothetical protein